MDYKNMKVTMVYWIYCCAVYAVVACSNLLAMPNTHKVTLIASKTCPKICPTYLCYKREHLALWTLWYLI